MSQQNGMFHYKMLTKYFIACFFLVALFACESRGFESDKRQMLAIDEVRSKTQRTRLFSVTDFRQDTLEDWPDTSINNPIQYTIDFVYKDSSDVLQKKRGMVTFAPEGYAIINTQIVNRQ